MLWARQVTRWPWSLDDILRRMLLAAAEPLNGALRGREVRPSSLRTGQGGGVMSGLAWGLEHSQRRDGYWAGLGRRGGGARSREGRGHSQSHFSPSLSQVKLTGGLLLTLTHVRFKASPGRSAEALARIVTLVEGTWRTGQRSEAQG